MDPYVGTRLGSYLLLEVLGAGGSCTVYRARHIDLGTEFAVKVLPYGQKLGEDFDQRLRREAAAAIRIDHPRIVKVLELGISPRGPYLVMELLEGQTLRAVLSQEGRLAPERAARIVRQTAEALAAAHRAGFIHRDLKPGNLMLVPSPRGEQVKLLDFGIVRLRDAESAEKLTRDDLILGTPSYMAPEQFQSSNVGPAADLYALGVVLYEMLTGSVPFEGTFREIVAQHMVLQPPQPPEAGGLEELAMWLMEKDPTNRPPDAERVIEVIDRRFPALLRSNDATPAPVAIVRGTPDTPPPRITSRIEADEPSITAPRDVDSENEELVAMMREAELDTMVRSRPARRSSRFRRPRRLRFAMRLALPLAWCLAVLATALAAERITRGPEPAGACTVENATALGAVAHEEHVEISRGAEP